MQKSCIFCDKPANDLILENDQAKAFYDLQPMSKGHLLIMPKGHYVTWFDVPEDVQVKVIELINDAKKQLDKQDHPQGYQVFSHVGKAAGQTVFHAHIHLVPVY